MVRVHAPATIGNFGPGFDAFSLALADEGDVVTLEESDHDHIVVTGSGADEIPTDWGRNTASVTLDALRSEALLDVRFSLTIEKRQPGGSGLGSSASSAGGAALAFHALYPNEGLSAMDLVRAAGEGEAVAAGYHFDDVSSVILGGLAIARHGQGEPCLRRIQPPADLWITVARPALQLRTREMRSLLPRAVSVPDAVHNVANAALLVDAFHRGDIDAIGNALGDRLVTPARKSRIPCFDAVRDAALGAGAAGFAMSGSGPAMFAVSGSQARADSLAGAMQEAMDRVGQRGDCFVARPERREMHVAVQMH